MTLYLRTTVDEYELPIAVAESAKELAGILGTTPGSVMSSISHKRPGWFRIEVEDETKVKHLFSYTKEGTNND